MGETRPAIRPGRRQESSTVARENTAAPTKIQGLAEATTETLSRFRTTTGARAQPASHPRSKPTGIPAAASSSAWLRRMRRNCRGVVPMVFSSP